MKTQQCQICGKILRLTEEEWQRYSEEHLSDTDHGDVGFICADCQDWQPGEDEEE